MAVVVQEKNTFLRLVLAEEHSENETQDVATVVPARAQSVPPHFRMADVKLCSDGPGSPSTAPRERCVLPTEVSKQWSDSMSESTEAPNDSSDLDDLFSFAATPMAGSPKSWSDAASSCGSDDSPQSKRYGDDLQLRCFKAATPLQSCSSLRLGARRYNPRSGQVNIVLSMLMSYLCSLPVVTNVAEKRSNSDKSVHYLVTIGRAGMGYAGNVVAGAQQALLDAALNSQSVYVQGHAREPFTPLGVLTWGFQARLCAADEYMCMDAVDYGRCNRWCPRTECRRRHPQERHLTNIVLELQEEH